MLVVTHCFIALFILTTHVDAQGFLTTQGKSIVDESGNEVLLRGMGLGGWMLQEGYMLQTAEFANPQYQIRQHIEELIGSEKTQEFYDAWLANHVREQDIAALKSWGFNSVRLPMHYNLFTLPIQEEPIEGENTWLDKGLELTDSLLAWCKKNEMYIVLDLHAAPGGQGYDQGISDYDTNLPSLWESSQNQDKTVALWRRIADHYKDESWIAGYDLINEPNWDLNQNQALRNLYGRITEAIREVDQRHIIFIEGNWFANDFTGLTPPWDNNMVYSPHKYWSINDQTSIQWVLDLRNNYNVPLYLGETGENSNVWFKDAVELYERNNMGWAWWPMKKVESISGPLSVEKTEGYQLLLDYWKGIATKPEKEEAYEILMDLTEKLKFEQCRYQPDVIDALFRQQDSNETLAFSDNSVPGVVYASDYDFGSLGNAYNDTEVANYAVSTSVYTSWNNGWAYRNDGVDIEHCEDDINTNGYNVGWLDKGEWMKYTLNVLNDGEYDIHMRVASNNTSGQITIEIDEAKASDPFPVPNTGDFQNWQTMVIPGIHLCSGSQELVFFVEEGGFNFSSFDFKYKGSSSSSAFKINDAKTLSQNRIELQLNKALDQNLDFRPEDFSLLLDGQGFPFTDITYEMGSERKLILITDASMRSDQSIRINYGGSSISAKDNSSLVNVQNFWVNNLLDPVRLIPGIIQAENFTIAEGIEFENTSDIGGGQNIAYLDPGDYLEYEVFVEQTANYFVRYRVASQNTSGRVRLSFTDLDGQTVISEEFSFPISGDWQTWLTTESELELEAGAYVMRIDILNAPFNLNWIEFESQTIEEEPELGLSVFPNPVFDKLIIEAAYTLPHEMTYKLYNSVGQLTMSKVLNYSDIFYEELELSSFQSGIYFLIIELEDGTRDEFKLMKK